MAFGEGVASYTGAASWETKLPTRVSALQLSPGGQLAITTDSVDNIRAIAADAGAASWEAKLPSEIGALQLTPDGAF